MWRELKNPNIFTMEASFCGPKNTTSEVDDLNYHYTADDLMEIGRKLCQTILLYNSQNIDTSKQIEEIRNYHTKKVDIVQPAQVKAVENRNSNQLKSDPKRTFKKDEPEIDIQSLTLKDIVSELKAKIQLEKSKPKKLDTI